MIVIIFVGIGLALIALKVWYQKISSKDCTSKRRMDGKIVIVTGANTGIGKETAKDLAKRGAKVILACRDLSRAHQAKREIVKCTGSSRVEVMRLDLGSLASVRGFAVDFLRENKQLDVLINNAAAMSLPNKLSSDGLQQEMQINQFGPFLLTILLLGIMKETPESRIVVVSSRAHTRGKIEFDNLNCEKSHPGTMQLYSNAKLANVLFSNELARRLSGTGIICNSLHPGVVKTEIGRNFPKILNYIIGTLTAFFIKTAAQGAQTSVHCAVSRDIEGVTGKYFVDCKETAASTSALDQDLAKGLWHRCVECVKLTPEELRALGI